MNKYIFSLGALFLASCDDLSSNKPKEDDFLKKPIEEVTVVQHMGSQALLKEESISKQKVFQTQLECEDGDIYQISMSETGKDFSIYLNEELLISSEGLSQKEREATQEIALKMAQNLKLIANAEAFLLKNHSKTVLGLYQAREKNTLQIPRMKRRVHSAKADLLDNVTKMMQVLIECDEKEPEFLQEDHKLSPAKISTRGRYISRASFSYQNEG